MVTAAWCSVPRTRTGLWHPCVLQGGSPCINVSGGGGAPEDIYDPRSRDARWQRPSCVSTRARPCISSIAAASTVSSMYHDRVSRRPADIPEFPNMATSFSDPRLTGIMYSSSAEYNTDAFAPQLAGAFEPVLLEPAHLRPFQWSRVVDATRYHCIMVTLSSSTSCFARLRGWCSKRSFAFLSHEDDQPMPRSSSCRP